MMLVRNLLNRPLCLDLGNRVTFRLLARGKKQLNVKYLNSIAIKECIQMNYICITNIE